MESLNEETINCPYCGEAIDVLIDPQELGHEYIEDCQVCCRPITFLSKNNEEGPLLITVHGENDNF